MAAFPMRTALRVTTHSSAIGAMGDFGDSSDECVEAEPLIGGSSPTDMFHRQINLHHQQSASASIISSAHSIRVPCTPDLSSSSSVYSTPSLSRRSSSSGCSKSVRFAPCLAASIHFTHSADAYDRTPIMPAPASESLVLPPHSKSHPEFQDCWLRAAARSAAGAHCEDDLVYGDDAATPFMSHTATLTTAHSYFPPTNTSPGYTVDMMLELGMHQDDDECDDRIDSHGLCAMGKWSRGDLYSSCDALGGF